MESVVTDSPAIFPIIAFAILYPRLDTTEPPVVGSSIELRSRGLSSHWLYSDIVYIRR
jgi:hypothetical protein